MESNSLGATAKVERLGGLTAGYLLQIAARSVFIARLSLCPDPYTADISDNYYSAVRMYVV